MLGLNSLLHRTLRQRLHLALVEHVLKAPGQVRRIPVPRAATACDSTLRSDSHSCCLRRAWMFGDTHHTSSPTSAAARSSYRWNMWPGTNATHVCLRNIRGRRLYVVVRSTNKSRQSATYVTVRPFSQHALESTPPRRTDCADARRPRLPSKSSWMRTGWPSGSLAHAPVLGSGCASPAGKQATQADPSLNACDDT